MLVFLGTFAFASLCLAQPVGMSAAQYNAMPMQGMPGNMQMSEYGAFSPSLNPGAANMVPHHQMGQLPPGSMTQSQLNNCYLGRNDSTVIDPRGASGAGGIPLHMQR